MGFFDSGHLASGLEDLDAVADEDGLEVDAKEAWVEPEDQSAPGVGELVQIQGRAMRSEEHTSELQSRQYLVCRLLLEKKKKQRATQSHGCRQTQHGEDHVSQIVM